MGNCGSNIENSNMLSNRTQDIISNHSLQPSTSLSTSEITLQVPAPPANDRSDRSDRSDGSVNTSAEHFTSTSAATSITPHINTATRAYSSFHVNAKDNNGMTRLARAAERGDLADVTLLLDSNANLHAKDNEGRTSLHIAAQKGHVSIVAILLDRGADPNSKGRDGRTPLHAAAQYKHINIVALLLSKGANPNANSTIDYEAPLIVVVVREIAHTLRGLLNPRREVV